MACSGFFASLLLAISLLAGPAWATLGEPLSSLNKDEVAFSATTTGTTEFPAYSVVELKSPYGFVLREYASTNGSIFAVAWSGMRHPDLEALLGRYAREFYASSTGWRKPGHRSYHRVSTPTLDVQRWGHPGALAGRAYLPLNLPSGVSPSDLK